MFNLRKMLMLSKFFILAKKVFNNAKKKPKQRCFINTLKSIIEIYASITMF
jgi:hypothetical protein